MDKNKQNEKKSQVAELEEQMLGYWKEIKFLKP